MPALSILDLVFVPEGGTPADALRNTRDLAQHASAATAVVIGYAGGSSRARRRASRAALDIRLEFIRRAARRHPWTALRFCFTFRAHCLDTGATRISRAIQTVDAT
jgi:hypothetical protein